MLVRLTDVLVFVAFLLGLSSAAGVAWVAAHRVLSQFGWEEVLPAAPRCPTKYCLDAHMVAAKGK